MTALTKYQKLECSGLWRENAGGQRREVIANFGDTSLILSDPKQDMALAHWSLPAIKRLNPGEMPALFAPGPDEGETLEVDDAEMIAALETVHAAIRAASPHPGRLRNSLLGVMAIGVLAVGVFWLPDALVQHTASFLPRPTRAEIGRAALADLTRLTGQPCKAKSGQAALTKLSGRLFGPDSGVEIVVVRTAVAQAQSLPGRLVVLSESLLAEHDGPEAAAGFALAARITAEMKDPMLPLLHHAGIGATFRLLTSGALPDDAIAGYAETLIEAPQAPPSDAILLARFEAAGLATTPYAHVRDPSGESTLHLIEADPFSNVVPAAILPDGDWVSLQDICTR
ncbi:hypothetical protein EOK75_19250 (plasmid) [Pseudorhodobacter turbinis]|uniref:Uncharacterized protein n=1 Tax=Pseudorhodobacter turbinis TaxID=2500533 RepID=A0A4P8ELF6_9RHOB|nr:hypothetical protein [Pseudorhodobacter turbinis]QCO57813.1 hypothetical protein EOK75_19250 [Pseudorhodobacter turbinis]